MKAYLYQAAMLCEACAKDVMAQTKPPVGVDPDNPDERLYDSSDYPKGPYSDGGGASDTPQHCDHCGVFLENPLTTDGVAYLYTEICDFNEDGKGNAEVIETWYDFYRAELAEYLETLWNENKS